MDKKVQLLMSWLTKTPTEVLDKFHSLNGSFSTGKEDQRFVYVKGNRPDKVLLVAHCDTVWDGHKVHPIYHDGIIFSKCRYEVEINNKNNIKVKRDLGIGGDDRCGCFAVWSLRNMGHSLLITSGEERGCISSRYLMNSRWWQKEIADHQFAIQFDRRGYKDIVFYDVYTKDFKDYVKGETGYTIEEGSFTDIRYLCKDICGVNISIGFYNEHQPEEKIVPKHTFNTINTVYHWISKKVPKFPLIKYQPKYENQHRSTHVDTTYKKSKKNYHGGDVSKKNDIELLSGEIVTCVYCKQIMPVETWFENELKCPSCHKEF